LPEELRNKEIEKLVETYQNNGIVFMPIYGSFARGGKRGRMI